MADELSSASPVETQVLAANRAFYDAFEALDLDRMTALWEQGDRSSCVHPGGPRLTGWAEVLSSWEAILGHTRYIEFEVVDPVARVIDPVAWVTCLERVTSAEPSGRTVTDLTATNLFVLGPEGWRMVLHHAAPVALRAVATGEPDPGAG